MVLRWDVCPELLKLSDSPELHFKLRAHTKYLVIIHPPTATALLKPAAAYIHLWQSSHSHCPLLDTFYDIPLFETLALRQLR